MKLTEEIVMQRLRNCSPPLENITQINITGRELNDISLLRRMTSIEILSLSVNKISCLYDLQFCKFLKELYLRKNNISDINEIYYIQDLPCLTILGLSQNPCSDNPNYRFTVIRNLIKLEKLDDEPIIPEERVKAMKRGLKVVNPEEAAAAARATEILASDRGTLRSPSPAEFQEERPQNDNNPFVLTDSKVDDLEKATSHQSSKLRLPSTAGSKYFQTDSLLPEKGQMDVPAFDRPKSVGGVGHSNLLPGILVLVTDLDYPSLEILSVNIKNRLNEFQMNNSNKV